MDELLSRDMLTKEERASIQEADVLHFYQSDLARRMAQSGERHAEWPFTLLADSDMILQGVLDNCFVEDNAWVLVDYKTDWGEAAMLADRYRDQMRWYMRALREITGMPVKEAWLYLLRGRQAVQITEDEPIRLKETPL
jgi:ATP-dependent helicase/nuclease subunit A